MGKLTLPLLRPSFTFFTRKRAQKDVLVNFFARDRARRLTGRRRGPKVSAGSFNFFFYAPWAKKLKGWRAGVSLKVRRRRTFNARTVPSPRFLLRPLGAGESGRTGGAHSSRRRWGLGPLDLDVDLESSPLPCSAALPPVPSVARRCRCSLLCGAAAQEGAGLLVLLVFVGYLTPPCATPCLKKLKGGTGQVVGWWGER